MDRVGRELTMKEYEKFLRNKEERVAHWERYGVVQSPFGGQREAVI